MRCAIDFDGTLRQWGSGEPEPNAKESIIRMKKAGYRISILSCRTSCEFTDDQEEKQHQKKFIEDYLKKYDIPFDEVLEYDKPIADFYIDDSGIEYKNNWKEITDRIVNEQD
jgi:hypothetical protein